MGYDVTKWKGDGTLPVLYSKAATGAIVAWQCWVENEYVCVRWGQLDGAMQEARFACVAKNTGRSNATTAHEQAVKEAVAKWKKQIKKKYSETIDTAGVTKRIKPMLALDWKDQRNNIQYPVYMQPKLDGVRCLAYLKDGQVFLQSRGGDPILLPHIQREIQPALGGDFVLDGELYIHGTSLQSIMSLVTRPREESEQLYYCVYDMFNLNQLQATWDLRKSWLYVWFGDWQKGFNKLHLTHTNIAACEADALYLHRVYAEQGYEGGIIRTYYGLYREGYRSPDLLKMKEWEDDEFPIVGYTVGKGKFENVPIFTCRTKAGKDFEVTPKGSQKERDELLRLAPTLNGQLLKVKYLGFTEEGKPRCARGICLRDKTDL